MARLDDSQIWFTVLIFVLVIDLSYKASIGLPMKGTSNRQRNIIFVFQFLYPRYLHDSDLFFKKHIAV